MRFKTDASNGSVGIHSVQEGCSLSECLCLKLRAEVNVPSMQTHIKMAFDSGVFKCLLGMGHVYGGQIVMVALKLSRLATTPSLAGTRM